MLLATLLMTTAAYLPLPAEGAAPLPIHIRIAESGEGDPELPHLVAGLQRAVCASSRHVRAVAHAEEASVVFTVDHYDVTMLGDRQRHQFTGRYYIKGGNPDGERFRSCAGAGAQPGPPAGLGRFVENILFGPAASEDDLAHARDRTPTAPVCLPGV
jgi:hypothetical protein